MVVGGGGRRSRRLQRCVGDPDPADGRRDAERLDSGQLLTALDRRRGTTGRRRRAPGPARGSFGIGVRGRFSGDYQSRDQAARAPAAPGPSTGTRSGRTDAEIAIVPLRTHGGGGRFRIRGGSGASRGWSAPTGPRGAGRLLPRAHRRALPGRRGGRRASRCVDRRPRDGRDHPTRHVAWSGSAGERPLPGRAGRGGWVRPISSSSSMTDSTSSCG